MRYFADSRAILPLSNVLPAELAKISYGSLTITLDNALYTSDIEGKVLRLGNSFRKLEQMSDYFITESSYGILRFSRDAFGVMGLSLSVPSISLNDLSDVEVINSLPASYLGFDSTTLSNHYLPVPAIEELADVRKDSAALKDNWVLTTSYSKARLQREVPSQGYKDPFGEELEYTWSLKPEASSLVAFDDSGIQAPLSNQVLRIPRISEQRGYLYENIGLDISYDKAPILSASLDCNQHSLFNVKYRTDIPVIPSNSAVSISLDLQFDVTILKPSSVVKLLVLDIPLISITTDQTKIHAVLIEGFTGELVLPYYVRFENGRAPVFLGKDVLLSILLIGAVNPYVICTQKALSMS